MVIKMKPVKNDNKKENKYWQTTTGKILVVTLVFAIIVVAFTLVTGQIAYGNVYGKLFNDSKVPDVQFQGSPYAMNNTSGSILVFNVTDLDGPNQAAVTEIILTNVTTGKNITLTSQNISMDIYRVVDAKYHYRDNVKYNQYNGIYVPLGDEATIYMNLTTSLHHNLSGKYKVTLVVPTQKAKFATADVTF